VAHHIRAAAANQNGATSNVNVERGAVGGPADAVGPPAQPNTMMGKFTINSYGAPLRLPKMEPPCLMDLHVRPIREFVNAHGYTAFRDLETFCAQFEGGLINYQHPDCSDIVAIPADPLHGIPDVTYWDLTRFRKWGKVQMGASPIPLSPEARRRHGHDLSRHNKRHIGDRDEIVELTDDFKRQRFEEIRRQHETESNKRIRYEGNRPTNTYHEHYNSGGTFNSDPYSCGAYAALAEARELDQIGFGQIPRRPVSRSGLQRVLPRILKGARPSPPEVVTYNYVPPFEVSELPQEWRTKPDRCGFDVPYASAPLVVPAEYALRAPFGGLTLGSNDADASWQISLKEFALLDKCDPDNVAMHLLMEYHSRFQIPRKELFHFLLYKIPFDTLAGLFLSHPASLYAQLQELLSPADQALILVS